MARIRTIKPEFWTAEQIMECSPIARLLFIGMWNFCDDCGVHPAALKTLKAEVFPGDDITSEDVRRMIDEIIAQGLLCEFEHEGRRWWYVTGWKHQLINRPTPSRYPRPPRTAPLPLAAGPDGISGKGLDEQFQPENQTESMVDCATSQGALTEDSLRTQGALTEDSLRTQGALTEDSLRTQGALTEDSLRTQGALTEDSLQEGKGRERKGKERKGEEQKPAQQASTPVQARDPGPAAVAAVRFDAAEFLVGQGADSQTAADYLLLRKGKKAAATATAMQAIVTEAGKAGLTLQAALELCCNRGWAGLKAEWTEVQQARAGPRQTLHDQRKSILDELTGRNRNEQNTDPRDITAEVIRIA